MSDDQNSYTPLSLTGTITSGSGYAYSSPVWHDQFVDANTYFNEEGTTRPYVLRSAVNVKELTHSPDEFVGIFNSAATSDERRCLRDHFYRFILPRFRSKGELQDLSEMLTCADEHIRCRIIEAMRMKVFRHNIEVLDIKPVVCAIRQIASYITSHKDENKDSVIPLFTDLILMLLVKERTLPTVQKELQGGLKEVYDYLSKASKKVKDPVMSSLHTFFGKCLKRKISNHGLKLVEGWGEYSIEETVLQNFIQNVQNVSAVEVYLLLLALVFKVQFTSMTSSTVESFLEIAHVRLKCVVKEKDNDSSGVFLANFIIRGIVFLFEKKHLSCQNEKVRECLIEAIKFVRSPKSPFAEIPCEMMQLVLKIDSKDALSLWSNISLSDDQFQRMILKHAQAQIPGLVLRGGFGRDREILGKRSDHSVWLRTKGTFMSRFEVEVKVFVTGRYSTKLNVTPQEDIEFSNTETEFDILKTIQNSQQHRNIAQMLAFCDFSPRTFAMFAVERYERTLLKYFYDARSNNDELSLKWKVKRCLEMLSAIDFLHHHKIVHRDIMAEVFSMRHNCPEPEVVVLTSFKRAISNDEVGNTTIIGHVRDLNSTQIATRWSAPESFIQDRFDRKTDIWMLGHAIREVFTCGCQPYTEMYSEDTENIMAKVIYCRLKPYKWSCIPKDIHLLTLKCLEMDPRERPSISEIYRSLQNIQRKEADEAKPRRRSKLSGSTSGSRISFYPKLDETQDKPERGIPKLLQDLRKQREEDPRATYIGLRSQSRTQRNGYAVSDMELSCADTPEIKKKRDKLVITEPISRYFYEKILGKMSEDFASKMRIQTWPLNPFLEDERNQYPFKVEYNCPLGDNIMVLAKKSLSQREHLIHMIEVAKLMERMHDKYWILVDVCGQNIYLTRTTKQAFIPRIGRMLRLELPFNQDDDVVVCPTVHSNRIHWQPVEVIRNSEYSMDSDVYMLAMVFYEYYSAVGLHKFGETDQGVISLACVPFATVEINQILCDLLNGEIPVRPTECPVWLYEDVMIPCWAQERTSRPSIKQIVILMNERLVNADNSPEDQMTSFPDEYDHNYLRDQASGSLNRRGANSGSSNTCSTSSSRSASSNNREGPTSSCESVQGSASENDDSAYLSVIDMPENNPTAGKISQEYLPRARHLNSAALMDPSPIPHNVIHKDNPLFQSMSSNYSAKTSQSARSSSSAYHAISPRDVSTFRVNESVRREQQNFSGDSSLFQSSFSETSNITFTNESADGSFGYDEEESGEEIEFVNDSDNDD